MYKNSSCFIYSPAPDISWFLLFFLNIVYGGGVMCTTAHVWRSENNWWLILYSHHWVPEVKLNGQPWRQGPLFAESSHQCMSACMCACAHKCVRVYLCTRMHVCCFVFNVFFSSSHSKRYAVAFHCDSNLVINDVEYLFLYLFLLWWRVIFKYLIIRNFLQSFEDFVLYACPLSK